jgi:hypothetical protein
MDDQADVIKGRWVGDQGQSCHFRLKDNPMGIVEPDQNPFGDSVDR